MKILAKIGIILGALLIILVVVVLINKNSFNTMIKEEVNELAETTDLPPLHHFGEGVIYELPAPVQEYFQYVFRKGFRELNFVRLKQNLQIKTAPGNDFMSGTAEQYFSIKKPGFVWVVNIDILPLLYINGRDKYFEGSGNMLIQLLSTFSLVDADDKAIDEGSFIRYVAEAFWFPYYLIPHENLDWEPMGERSAKLIAKDYGLKVELFCKFNEKNQLVELVSHDRKYNGEPSTWIGRVEDYREVYGMMVPHKVDVRWILPDGREYVYFKGEITEIEYNKTGMFD